MIGRVEVAAEGADTARWQARLAQLAERHDVPGAVLGILPPDGPPLLGSTGVLNTSTGVEVSDDSVFQIGSVTKVWTASLVMRLVEDGIVDLDAPVQSVLPELRLMNDDATQRVTMRHLLAHTSGLDGDVFTDTGRGDDCLERYVDQLADVPQLHAPGAAFSYCNAGYILAGRVVERLTGCVWDEALRQWLIEPLGLERTVTLPEEALRFRTAMGHVRGLDGRMQPAPVWDMPRSCGPAGLIKATVGDLLEFARCHLRGGTARDGTRVLAEATTAAMAAHEAAVPDASASIDSWGLGWSRFRWQGRTVIGHDGATIGQSAYLRLLPDLGLTVALVANGGDATSLQRQLFAEIFAALAGLEVPPAPAPPADVGATDLSARCRGRYERASLRIEIHDSGSGPRLRQTVTGPLASLTPDPVQETLLVPATSSLAYFRLPAARAWTPISFYTLPTGERFAHLGSRAMPKVAG